MSKSELHDWECEIEELSGNNADKMLGIARDIYKTAFVRGRNSMTWEQTRWIPVSEKLPEEETDVLICNSKGNIEVSRGSVFDDGTWEWYTSGWHFGEVLAWMPLPEPYQLEMESEE